MCSLIEVLSWHNIFQKIVIRDTALGVKIFSVIRIPDVVAKEIRC